MKSTSRLPILPGDTVRLSDESRKTLGLFSSRFYKELVKKIGEREGLVIDISATTVGDYQVEVEWPDLPVYGFQVSDLILITKTQQEYTPTHYTQEPVSINPVETFYESIGVSTPKSKGFTFKEIAKLSYSSQFSKEEVRANAQLIIEAFDVARKSGLTPAQLLTKYNQLLNQSETSQEEIKKLLGDAFDEGQTRSLGLTKEEYIKNFVKDK